MGMKWEIGICIETISTARFSVVLISFVLEILFGCAMLNYIKIKCLHFIVDFLQNGVHSLFRACNENTCVIILSMK
jgi:hypothetical protein